MEVRYIDTQPGRRWALPAAVVSVLLGDPAVTDAAMAACEPAAGRWVAGARHGLADRVLARAAATVFELACAQLPVAGAPEWVVEDLVDMTERQVLRGRCPADEADRPAEAPPAVTRPAGTHPAKARPAATHSASARPEAQQADQPQAHRPEILKGETA
jgi:glutamate--cysteine ligase